MNIAMMMNKVRYYKKSLLEEQKKINNRMKNKLLQKINRNDIKDIHTIDIDSLKKSTEK